jgi:hypothetical protein
MEENEREPLSRVTMICWMLVAVTLILIFAAKVSIHAEDMKWSRVVTPPRHPACTIGVRCSAPR